ncbi:MAG: GntR family transcriptional regulator [Enterococcus sp.]
MKRTRILYFDIAEKIKKDIFSGKYPVGSMLPTENELEAMFNVSKITIRKAIELLASDQYVEKKSGRGTTVISNRPYNRLSKAASFTQILEDSQFEVRKETLDLQLIQLDANHPLRQYFGTQVNCLKRLYYLNDQPYIYFVHYLPTTIKIKQDSIEQESLYRLITQNGYEISSFSDDFAATFLGDEERQILQTGEKIGMKRMRTSITEMGEVVEYSEALYNTALHPYHIDYET